MSKPFALVAQLLVDPRGTTSIEYAIIAMVIAVAIVGAITTFGTEVGAMWNNINLKVGGAG